MSDFDVQGARKEGYSDAEIADYLASQRGFDVQGARKEGYKDREIIDHLSPPPSMGRRALNAAGDAASAVGDFAERTGDYVTTQKDKAIGSLAGIPRAMADVAKWGMDKAGIPSGALAALPGIGPILAAAQHLPTGQEVSSHLIESNKKWQPGFQERSIHPVVDAGVQAMISGPAMGVGGRAGPIVNALGGAGSEAAGRLAHDYDETHGTSWETPARIAGAVVGGGVGAGGVAAVDKLGKVSRSLVEPFTAGGRDKAVGTALRKAAADPDAAVANIEKYTVGREAFPDSVPGFKIDAGKASRDPGLMAAADTLPDRIRGLNVQNNNSALTGALDKATAGMPPVGEAGGTVQKILADRFKAGQEARSAGATPLYDAARKFPEDLPVGSLFKYVDEAIAANKGGPKATMESARKLLFNSKGEPDFSASGLMAARDGVGALFTPTLDKHTRELLVGLRNRIDAKMQSVPEAAAARAKFAELSKPLEPFGKKTHAAKIVEKDPITKAFVLPEGKVLGDLKAKDVQNILMASGGDSSVKRSLASAYLDDFKNTVGNSVQTDQTGGPMLGAYPAAKWMEKHGGAARNVLSDDQIRALDDITKHLGDQAQSVPGRSGSPTFDRLASESIVGAIINPKYGNAPGLHIIRKMLGTVYGGADEAIRDRLYEVIADPAAAKVLMKKATPGNVKMAEPVLSTIAWGAAVPAARESQ